MNTNYKYRQLPPALEDETPASPPPPSFHSQEASNHFAPFRDDDEGISLGSFTASTIEGMGQHENNMIGTPFEQQQEFGSAEVEIFKVLERFRTLEGEFTLCKAQLAELASKSGISAPTILTEMEHPYILALRSRGAARHRWKDIVLVTVVTVGIFGMIMTWTGMLLWFKYRYRGCECA